MTGRRGCSRELQKLPQLRDVASDQQTSGTMVSFAIDRDQAARFGIQPSLIDKTLYDAFGQRQVDAVLHAAQQLSRDSRGHPGAAGGSEHPEQALYQVAR